VREGLRVLLEEAGLTVETHVSNLLAKLQLDDRTRAAVYAWRRRLVPADDAAAP
jgi:DNA-binding NarL/FixJ family response regulator